MPVKRTVTPAMKGPTMLKPTVKSLSIRNGFGGEIAQKDNPTITLSQSNVQWEDEVYRNDPTGGMPHPY
jgi:hypothetical protein